MNVYLITFWNAENRRSTEVIRTGVRSTFREIRRARGWNYALTSIELL